MPFSVCLHRILSTKEFVELIEFSWLLLAFGLFTNTNDNKCQIQFKPAQSCSTSSPLIGLSSRIPEKVICLFNVHIKEGNLVELKNDWFYHIAMCLIHVCGGARGRSINNFTRPNVILYVTNWHGNDIQVLLAIFLLRQQRLKVFCTERFRICLILSIILWIIFALLIGNYFVHFIAKNYTTPNAVLSRTLWDKKYIRWNRKNRYFWI